MTPHLRRLPLFLVLSAFLAACGCDAFVTRPHLAARRLAPPPFPALALCGPEFDAAMYRITRAPLRRGNRAHLLLNGQQVFPAMMADIRAARREILISTYIFSSDRIGFAFAELLARKAREGVRVRFLFDAFGSVMDLGKRAVRLMRKAGVEVKPMNPLLGFSFLRYNNRCHAKMLVVDGRIGYVMGLNLSEKYCGTGRERRFWRDDALRVRGPVVSDMRRAFDLLWREAGRGPFGKKPPLPFLDLAWEKVRGGPWPPPAAPPADPRPFPDGVPVRVLFTQPGWFHHEAYDAFLQAIYSARNTIDMTFGYFLPDHPMAKALLDAARRGVRIRIVLPDRLDIYFVKKTSLECASKLCRRGIELYAYRPALLHAKAMVVDGKWATLGSMNVNGRTFFLNYDCNLIVWGGALPDRLERAFETDLRLCKRLTPRDLRPRNPLQFLVHKALYLMKDQM